MLFCHVALRRWAIGLLYFDTYRRDRNLSRNVGQKAVSQHTCTNVKTLNSQLRPSHHSSQPGICPYQKTGEYLSLSVRSILIVYPRLSLGLTSVLLSLCFDIKILHTFFSSPIISDLIVLKMRGEQHKS